MKQRPFPVTVLAILSGIAALFAAVHALQALGILPLFFVGGPKMPSPNWWSAFTWALMVWVWVWLTRMLWNVEPQGWMFLAFISVFNLFFAATSIIFGGYGTTFSDYSLTLLVNGAILLYVMLPGTKAAFSIPNPKG